MATRSRPTDVKLQGSSANPYVNRVQFALNLKSIEYKLIEETTSDKNSEFLLQSNPIHKKKPVFFHADKAICESLIILQYIDEAWPNGPPILPSEPYERARARFWAGYIDEKWLPVIRELKKARGDEDAKRAVLDKILEGVITLEDAFVQSSNGKAFFGGDSIGYVDICLGSLLGWLEVISIITNVKFLDKCKTPRLKEWSEMFFSDEAVKGVVPETEKLLELLKVFQACRQAPIS